MAAEIAGAGGTVEKSVGDAVMAAPAPRLLKPGTYVEPFALRALGRVRGDPELVARAIDRFEALGLDWHAAQTLAAASV